MTVLRVARSADIDAILENYDEYAVVALAGKLPICGTYTDREKVLEPASAIFARLDPATIEFPTRYKIVAVDDPYGCVIHEVRRGQSCVPQLRADS